MDVLVWTIAHNGRVAQVGEDGSVSGDASLVTELRERLREPITVHSRGTVRGIAAGSKPIRMEPDDRRYVVARIRTLCSQDSAFEIVDCSWR